jgi:type IV pilus assembly protein PilY1
MIGRRKHLHRDRRDSMQRLWPIQIPTVAAATRVAVLMLLAGNAWAQYAVSQQPALVPNPPTNIVIMMDDSGSMQWAYVPDAYGACTGTRRFNAGTFNELAYNPNLVYPAPTILTSSGAQTLTTSFAAASIDGFNTGAGTINLSSGYQPTALSQPGSSGQIFSPHPSQDLAAIFSPSTPPAGAAAGGVGPNCGSGYGGSGGGGGNQFGPATGTNNAVGAPAYFYIYNATQTGCTSSANDDNCYQYVRVTSTTAPIVGGVQFDGFQNFANWYSFYRTRHLMIASAAASAMADPILSGARVSWRALNSCTDMVSGNNCAGWDGVKVDNRLRTFSGTQVTNFYQWLTRVPASSPTPTRSTWTYIGDYFSAPSSHNTALGNTKLGANGPYGINPNQPNTDTSSGEIACVQNYNITLTDGQWNQDSNTNGAYFGNADATQTTLPDTNVYTPGPTPPFAIYGNDTNHDTLSDVAFHYWATNLRPDLNGSATAVSPYYQVTTGVNGVPTTADYWNPQNDPATWPHLVQMTIGIGMTNTMNVAGLPWWGNNVATQYTLNSSTNAGYYNLYNGNIAWPAINNTAVQGDTGKAYDLWHAALNSRGLAFSAESAADLINAIGTSLNRIKVTMAAQTGMAVSAARVGNGAVVYSSGYTSSDWHGTVSAYPINYNAITQVVSIGTTPIWTTDGTGAGIFAPATTRSIATSSTSTVTATPSVSSGIAFSTSSSTFSAMWTNVAGANANILSWLRGDPTQEVRNGGAYRNRFTSVLGDIVDSDLTFAFHEDFGYSSLPEGLSATPNYISFILHKANTTGSIYSGKGMLYVGANDGMLHGFDAGTGKEVFAYVPHNVIPNLPTLADPAYAHRYYVDQTPYVGDACLHGTAPTTCTWSTVLVGTTGAGGQGVFALDVTNPASMESAAGVSSNVLWDFDGKGALATSPTNSNGDPDLGYPIGQPIVARLHDGNWAAVFGNGYLSARGCAVLFIVRLNDGFVQKIDTSGVSSTSTCTATNINAGNGLGPVTLSPVGGNGITDTIYAGDLQGNMWKFDLTSATSGGWKVALNGVPLFTASPGGGSCVLPANSTATNTCQPITSAPVLGLPLPGMTGTMVYFGTGRMFAVGDSGTTSTQSIYGILDNGTTPISGGQTALTAETATDNGTTRTFSNTPVTGAGWFVNLPDTGERVTLSPAIYDKYVVYESEVPTSSSCSGSATGWIMAIAATTANPFGPNTNQFFVDNPGVNGMQINGAPAGLSPISGGPGGPDYIGIPGGPGKPPQLIKVKNPYTSGRISWHELSH